MKDKTVQFLILLKQNIPSLPSVFLLITFLLTSYLLYPHSLPKKEVKGIASNNVTSKQMLTITPTPSMSNHKKPQSFVTTIPPVATSSNTNSTEATQPTTNNTSSDTNTSNNNSSAAVSLSNSDSGDQDIPTPSAALDPTSTPVDNNDVLQITPTPSENGNNANNSNSVGTIIDQVASNIIPQL